MIPADLQAAEQQTLAHALQQQGRELTLLFSDAGGAALARRDAPDMAALVLDLRQLQQQQAQRPSEGVLLAVAPAAADYETFESVCTAHSGAVLMVNGRLEDAAVGIGSVARERRKGFVATWQSAYVVQPLDGGALRRAAPGPWELYRLDADGYRLLANADQRPDREAIAAALSGDGGTGLGGTLRAVDALLEGLRN